MTPKKPARLSQPVRNEAAERLLTRLLTAGAWSDYENEVGPTLNDALAAERRATVERIAEKVALAELDALTPDVNRAEVNAILDEEAAR